MKNNELLRIYNEYLVIEPDISVLTSSGIINRYNYILDKFKKRGEELAFISGMYEGMMNQINFIKNYGHIEKPISGRKVLVDPGYEFFCYIESWWPNLNDLFSFSKPSLLPCIAEISKSKFGYSFSDLPDNYTGKNILDDISKDFKDYLTTQEWFGFNMGDKYNFKRVRPIKKRRLKFDSITFNKTYNNFYSAIVNFIDKNSKEFIIVNPGYGWELFYSEELMNERLQDIESFWIRRQDIEAKNNDSRIKRLERELEEAKRMRKEFLGKSIEFQKNIKNILWRDF